jgi:hypothetical protein
MSRRFHAALLHEAVRIRKGRPSVSPVRLIDGRWVNDDETMPERCYIAEDEHPGECWGKARDFPCLPLPEPLPLAPDAAEDAPWDDPTALSYEELAELIGL